MKLPKNLRPREIFSRMFWDPAEDRRNYEVTFIHRGASKDKKSIPCDAIVKFGRSWFVYSAEEGETLIPYHRILVIKDLRDGTVLWIKMGTHSRG